LQACDVWLAMCLLSVQQSVVQPKPSLAARVKEVALHYFNGFRLLVLDVRVAIRLLLKTMQGQTLTRRENRLFRRTVADMFRIVPFSVFIIIPFMEFLLPVYVYFFPNALPSTFQSSSSKVSLNSILSALQKSAWISNVEQCVKP
jgi:LETM1 and EF-hand domain-containing protein 1